MANDNVFLDINPVIHISLILGALFLILNVFLICIPGVNKLSVNIKIILVALLVFIFLFIIIYCFIYMLLIGGKSYEHAVSYISGIVSVPIIFTTIFLMISSSKQEVLSIFENTIGYFFCKIRYGKQIDEIFQFKENVFSDKKYLEHYEQHKGVLLTLFKYSHNFENIYKTFVGANGENESYSFYIQDKSNDQNNNNEDDQGNGNKKPYITQLQEIVGVKNTIGICSWFFISSLFASIISIKILSRI
jgi:hypothetical protein